MKLALISTIFAASLTVYSSAVADLSITGGSHDQRFAIQTSYTQFIPTRFHTSETVVVQLLDDTAMNRYLDNGNDGSNSKDADDTVDGVYEDGPPLITLRASRPDDELEYTVAHEFGHYVWQTQMTNSQRKYFNKIYNTQKSQGHLISDYAAFSVNEGFAEAFATYSTYPNMLKAKDPLSYEFINSLQGAATRDTARRLFIRPMLQEIAAR